MADTPTVNDAPRAAQEVVITDQPTVRAEGGVLPDQQIGRTGLNQSMGYIYEDVLTKLQGASGRKIYDEMGSNDPMVGALLFAIDKMVRNVEYTLRPADHAKGEEAAELTESAMGDMEHPWSEFISEVLSMLQFGFAPFEPVYKMRDDGRIGWKKLPIRAQRTLDRWQFDEDGELEGMWQNAPPHYRLTMIPIERLVNFRTTSIKDNPEGESVIRNAYWPWLVKHNIEKIEAIGIERELNGIPFFYHPAAWSSASATANQIAALSALKEMGERLRGNEQSCVLLPRILDENGKDLLEFKLIKNEGKRSIDVNTTITRKNGEILMTVLADFIILGHENSGSWALADSKTSVFAVALGAWLKTIAGTINRHLFPRLMEANALPVEAAPTIVPGDIETPDLGKLGDFLAKVYPGGFIMPDIDLENELRRMAGLPQSISEE
jgi:hypothetical protein